MAADDSKAVDIENQELDDKIICCICTNVYVDPKALPCVHTFCMKCIQETGLKTNKGPGDEMPCPICRRMFKIPPEGFRGLPNNFFIAKLIEVANISNLSDSSKAFCDACLDDNEGTGKKIPEADMYCTECKQKLCEECCRHHRKLKLTRNHKLMQINEQHLGDGSWMLNLSSSVCELHDQKVLDIYCIECKTVQCAVCFIDGHRHHEGSHVSKFVDDFRKQIENNIETAKKYNSQTLVKKEDLTKVKEDMQQKVEMLEFDVENRRDELKRFVDSQANSLLQSLWSLRQSKLKEIQMEAGDIDTNLSSLQSYSSYCEKMMAKGSDSDICRAVSDFSVKVAELQEQSESLIEREIQSFKFCFTKSEFEELIEDENLIGEIEEECIAKQRKTSWTTSKVALIRKQSGEIGLLKEEVNFERREKETFRLENEQLKIFANNDKKANKILKEELNKNATSYSAKITQLKLDLDNGKLINKTLQDNTEKLVQELKQELHFKKDLQVNINKLKMDFENERISAAKLEQELKKAKTTNITLLDTTDKLNEELDCEKTKSKTLQDANKKFNQELETHQNAIQNLLKGKGQANADWEKKGNLLYKSHPVLVQSIRTKAAEEKKKGISGLTILGKELFVASEDSSDVQVYDSIKFSFSRRWNLKELINPLDIVSCDRNKCLYINDYKGFLGRSTEILRVDARGKLISKWSTGNDRGRGLSVTDESNVILSVFNKHQLNEYSPDGQLIRKINLSSDAGIRHPWHAIRLTNGHFVVSHGSRRGDLQRVCIVDADGKLHKSFGGQSGSTIGQLDMPLYLSVDGNGFVMVADQMNSRVLLLDSNLDFKREFIKLRGLPERILLDESNDRLFVADNESNNSQIFIFDCK